MLKKIADIAFIISIILNVNMTYAKSKQYVVKGEYKFGWQKAGDYISKKDINTIEKSINASIPANAETNLAYQKAKCTIKLAQWTFKDVDTKGVTEDLVRQAVIFQYLAKNNVSPPEITPVPGTPRLYPERWNQIRSLKQSAACFVPEFDCAEVSLTGAEYEMRENYKSHAKKFLDDADKLISQGQTKAEQCQQPLPQRIDLTADVLFEFASTKLTASGRAKVAQFANQLSANYQKISVIHVAGHTDRIGSDSFNYQLSQDRALTVKNSLLAFAPNLHEQQIQSQGYGKERPVKDCQGSTVTAALKQCLQPNRRVEISIIQQAY